MAWERGAEPTPAVRPDGSAKSESAGSLPDPGTRPELVWLPCAALSVDRSYQRDASAKHSVAHIRRIAANFVWAMFQPPTVVPAGPSRYTIVDGQHRVAAAKLRGLDTVPCYVVKIPDRGRQAAAFVSLNADRVKVHPLTLHRAAVQANDPVAQRVQRACVRAGVTVPPTPVGGGMTASNQTHAIGTLYDGVRQAGEEAVTRALRCLLGAHPERKGQMRAGVLAALIEIAAEEDVSERRMTAALRRLGDTAALEARAKLEAVRAGHRRRNAQLVSILRAAYARSR